MEFHQDIVARCGEVARFNKNVKERLPLIVEAAKDARIKPMEDITSRYYFRFSALDRPGVLSKISGILGNYNISIAQVIQKGRKIGEAVPLVVLSHEAKEKNVRQALEEIDRLEVVMGSTAFIRVERRQENQA